MPKATKAELAWLGGIIDGEGHIRVHKDRSRPNYHVVRFQITNTDVGILKECYRILNKLDIFYYVHKTHKSAPNKKDCYAIEINRINECKEFGRIIRPFIKSRGKQQDLINLELYINMRKRRDGRKMNDTAKQDRRKKQLTLLEGGG